MTNNLRLKRFLLLCLAVVSLTACRGESPTPAVAPTAAPTAAPAVAPTAAPAVAPTAAPAVTPTAAPKSPSYWPTEGWRTSSPEQQGMESELLAEMLETIRERNHAIDSVTVIRNGYLVADATIYPFRPNSRHNIHSCAKNESVK